MLSLQATDTNCNWKANNLFRRYEGRGSPVILWEGGVKSSSHADPAHFFRKPLWDDVTLTVLVPCVIPFKIQVPGEGLLIGLAWMPSLGQKSLGAPIDSLRKTAPREESVGGSQNQNWPLILEEGKINAGQIKTINVVYPLESSIPVKGVTESQKK